SNGLGLDADLRRRKLGEHVILGAAKRIDAIGNQNAGERDDDTAEADCEGDDRRLRAGGENGAHSQSSTWICERNSSDRSNCAPRITISASFGKSFTM